MKQRVLYLFASCLCALGLLATPLSAIAEGSPQGVEQIESPAIIITEIQTGAATASDEFIELHNRSSEPVDIAGWQVRYVNSSVTTGTTTLLATITPTTGETLLLESGAYFVLHTASMPVSAAAGQVFGAALSKTDKTVALFARDETACQMIVQDAVAWEVTPGTTVGEGNGVVVSQTQASKEKLLQRFRDTTGSYVDTNHNSTDFVLSTTYTQASPGTDNAVLLPGLVGETGDPSDLAPITATDCTVPEPEDPPVEPPTTESPPSIEDPPTEEPGPAQPSIPAGNVGLKSPLLSELLPNPVSPQTDAKDEFIELYNPNDTAFDLTGYVLEVGTTTKRRYTFPAGTVLPSKVFKAYFSGDTSLALSNSGGQVRLIDPLGRVLVESDVYAAAKDNQVWLLANGQWQWSTKPTPHAVNVVSAPVVAKKKSSAQAKSASATKSATSGNAGTSNAPAEQDQHVVAAVTTSSLHPGVLALVGSFALLYGAYEYRQDVANKIRKLRQNRATRRQNRPGA